MGEIQTRGTNVASLNDRVEVAVTRMPKGRALGAGTPIGTVVGFKEYKEDGDERYRGVVVEDRGDRVLVSNMNSTLAFGSTNSYMKSELVSLGTERDDAGKIGRVDAIAYGDTQRIRFNNGSVVSITHGFKDGNRNYSINNGEYEVAYGDGRTSKNAALKRIRARLQRMSR